MGNGEWGLEAGDWGMGTRDSGAVSGQPMWEPAYRFPNLLTIFFK